MKIILRNTSLKFEKSMEKHFITSYDAFGSVTNYPIADTGNISMVDASAEDKRVQIYDVTAFAGRSLYIEVYCRLSPSTPSENITICSFSTNLVTHDDASSTSPYVLTMNNGLLTSNGLTKEWNDPYHAACCKISGLINIPANSKAMAIAAGQLNITGVNYPNNSKVYYYE